jgi:hypothetical protein
MLALLLGTLGCRPALAPDWEGPRVVVLVLDGVRDEDSFGSGFTAVGQGSAETIFPDSWAELVPQAARATAARSAGITVTGPAHVTLLAGHHAPFGNYHNEEGVGTYRPDLPTLLETFRSAAGLNQSQVLLVGNTSLIEPTAWSRSPEFGESSRARFVLVGNSINDSDPDNGGTDDTVVFDLLKQEIEDNEPVLIVANLHQTDRSTHNGEFEEYANHLTILDAQLPGFWEFLQAQPSFADNTWLIVAADHGRHDLADSSPPWRHHGDSCQGCRGVPWMVLGPGVLANTAFDGPVLLEDTASTVAALLGLSLPFSTGQVLQEAFSQDLPPGPSGLLGLAASGSALAELHSVDDRAHRAEVLLDGEVVSAPEALLITGPSLAQEQDRTWLCLRSMTEDAQAEEVPWVHWCGLRASPGSAWVDLALPWLPAAPYEEPVLLPDGQGGLVLITATNPTGVVAGSATNVLGLLAMRYQDGAWTEQTLTTRESFPTLPAAVLSGSEALVVVAVGEPGPDGRDTRALLFAKYSLETGRWSETQPVPLEAPDGQDVWGLERPALGLDGTGDLVLAALGHGLHDSWLVRAVSKDGGLSWDQSPALAETLPVLPHITPQVIGDEIWYGAWDSDTQQSWLCVVGPTGDSPACQTTGATHLRAFGLNDQGTHVILERGDGHWVLETLVRETR